MAKNSNNSNSKGPKKPWDPQFIALYVIIALMFIIPFIPFTTLLSSLQERSIKETSYNNFTSMVQNKDIEKVTINFVDPKFKFTDKQGKTYTTDNPRTEDFKEYLLKNNVEVVEANSDTSTNMLIYNLLQLVFLILFGYIVYHNFIKPRQSGKKKSRRVTSSVKFTHIAGNEEVKEDMEFLVEFLKNPQKYNEMGAKLPKGVILYGPPGTGKTMMAKAIAGEAHVPFLYASGSEFMEMYVGVGAKRVRELFGEAKKIAPCVIFIDEIDAVGSKRSPNASNGEKDQTLNALLTELDGFNGSCGIIVLAATNRKDILDDALTRSGRFDRHVYVPLPQQKDRLEILKIYAQNKKLSSDVSLQSLARETVGFSGADLATLINESTIIAVNKGHNEITKDDIDDAFFRVVMEGDKKKNRHIDEYQRNLVAWHEAGHALVAKLVGKDSIPKVTIIPSTSGAGGVTFRVPEQESLTSKEYLMNNVKIAYGGRIAEYLLLKDENKITTGASNDIKQATNTIRQLIEIYGMSEHIGMLNLTMFDKLNEGEILNEAKKLSKKLYHDTLDLLTKNKNLLEDIANKLIEKETIYEDELDAIIGAK